ncbi:NAD(P)-binding domain [Fusarium austroafricanum]|uniref:NAD(P)-binding domain n=1 Tax=Fusarium austroafricanum TaxID=2364996 RepID=A0A8H4P0V3_9HYPO|nr:NAD(P)-binding domain [Fusarium austroafricanum]
MSQNILITGAAGYIGGSIIADILSKHSDEIDKSQVFASVRSDEQSKALSNLGIKVLELDLADEQAVINEVSSHSISIVVHTASSIDPTLALPLINALAKQKETNGKPTHFIHTSALGAFYPKSGWPSTVNKDTDAVFETEKQLADSNPLRKSLQAVHITDLTALYWQIIHAVLHDEGIPSGKEGYYFGVAHDMDMWEFMEHLAYVMKTRGLVSEAQPDIFPSDGFAAEAIGIPVQFLDTIFKSGQVAHTN